MIAIPPGQVTLSDRRTQRRWSVELAPYHLAAVPISQAQYGHWRAAGRGSWGPVVRRGRFLVGRGPVL
jgi:hypothetical protein